ncbi:MAG: hypothetical protein EOO10_02785 [Chitinophagaceae bacterium]|nr:MAG: hypothetical protein EOO10_02785 [Chitinophagaceae bacterium]
MSTLIVAVNGVLIFILLVAVYINNYRKQKNKEQAFQQYYNQRLGRYQFTVNESGIHKDWLLAFDPVFKKLLYGNRLNENPQEFLVHLPLVKTCRVIPEAGSFALGGNGKADVINTFIGLELGFLSGDKSLRVPFYDYIENSVPQMADLRSKATTWEAKIKEHITSQNKLMVN